MTMYLRNLSKRKRREQREQGRLMSLAFNEPQRIDEDFADPPEVIAPDNTVMETEKWWVD
jgi:hypothetical protein